jgi:hypothetical protein
LEPRRNPSAWAHVARAAVYHRIVRDADATGGDVGWRITDDDARGALRHAVRCAIDAGLSDDAVLDAISSGDPHLDRDDVVALMSEAVAGEVRSEKVISRIPSRLESDADGVIE